MFKLELKFDEFCEGQTSNKSLPDTFESFEHLVIEVCHKLDEFDDIEFRVDGFDLNWPTDVYTDLSTIIPQVTEFLHEIRGFGNSEIIFFEQGIEKTLRFSRTDGTLKIECADMASGILIGVEEHLFISIEEMFIKFLRDFELCVRQRVPSIATSPFFAKFTSRSL